MDDSGIHELELLLLAVQKGILTRDQVDECLHDWEKNHGSDSSADAALLKQVAVRKGYVTEELLRELEARHPKDPAVTQIDEHLVMVCRECKAERNVSLKAALRKPRCAGCSGLLRFRSAQGSAGAQTTPRRPVSEEVRAAMADPKNNFSKYVLLSKLGSGGMGEVWRAWDTSVYRMVALKFPRTMGEEEIRRLHLEAQGAGGLSHPNIASIFEISQADGRHYIAMQYIPGKTAEDAVKGKKPDPREIVRWVRDAAMGVHYAHESGVIHRDLKPANVMIDHEGRVFVMDFGLAKLTSGEGSATVSGVILGTPAYMPPEQAAANAGQVDRRSDVYSLGAMLYTLLAGRRPFDGESATDILVQILTTEPPPLRKVWLEAPWELEAIVARAMSRARDQRYQTAKELAEDLDRFLKNEPVHAKRQSVLLRGVRLMRRRAGLIAVLAFCMFALGGGAAFYIRGGNQPPPPSGPDRLQVWAGLFPKLQKVISIEGFDAAAASSMMERLEREFPEQKESVAGMVEGEYKDLLSAIDNLPRARWIESAPRVKRWREWLLFMKKPVNAVDRILAYRGTLTLTVQVAPYAEVRGPLVEGLTAVERTTPLCVKDVEIRDGGIELVHPELGTHAVTLPPLKNGASLVVEGSLKDPKSIRVSEGP